MTVLKRGRRESFIQKPASSPTGWLSPPQRARPAQAPQRQAPSKHGDPAREGAASHRRSHPAAWAPQPPSSLSARRLGSPTASCRRFTEGFRWSAEHHGVDPKTTPPALGTPPSHRPLSRVLGGHAPEPGPRPLMAPPRRSPGFSSGHPRVQAHLTDTPPSRWPKKSPRSTTGRLSPWSTWSTRL